MALTMRRKRRHMPVLIPRRNGTSYLSHRFTKSQLSRTGQLSALQKERLVQSDCHEFPFNKHIEPRITVTKVDGIPFEELWTQEML